MRSNQGHDSSLCMFSQYVCWVSLHRQLRVHSAFCCGCCCCCCCCCHGFIRIIIDVPFFLTIVFTRFFFHLQTTQKHTGKPKHTNLRRPAKTQTKTVRKGLRYILHLQGTLHPCLNDIFLLECRCYPVFVMHSILYDRLLTMDRTQFDKYMFML